jgi:hypothetical protein
MGDADQGDAVPMALSSPNGPESQNVGGLNLAGPMPVAGAASRSKIKYVIQEQIRSDQEGGLFDSKRWKLVKGPLGHYHRRPIAHASFQEISGVGCQTRHPVVEEDEPGVDEIQRLRLGKGRTTRIMLTKQEKENGIVGSETETVKVTRRLEKNMFVEPYMPFNSIFQSDANKG